MSAHDAASLLIIDDNERSLEMLEAALKSDLLRVLTATDPEEGLEIVYRNSPQIVLTDLVMPKLSGMEVLERIAEFDPSIAVVLMTAHYSTESAVEAIQKGASDYLNKPVSIKSLREKVDKLLESFHRQQRAAKLEDSLLENCQFEGIIGKSAEMGEMFSRIRRVAPHYRTILITGPTGSGKDLVARALHRLSPASKGNFVVLNCSAVVETLFESELFGHVKGAFTGANQDKVGLVEHASGGTLFLDEIGDMPLSTQAKLLRTLQNQEVQRVGSLSARHVDLRVIAATHHDLRAGITEKVFREDLYYRLSMVELKVPPLAERKEDLPLLERHFIERFSTLFGKSVRSMIPRARILLSRHNWPGNVRELENAIGHACMMTLGDTIDVQDLPQYLWAAGSAHHPTAPLLPHAMDLPAASTLDEQERALVQDALERAGGNQSQAARILRIGRDALRYKMKKHNVS